MDWFTRALAAITALSALVGVIGKWAARRERLLKEKAILDWKFWATSEDGQMWFTAYISKHFNVRINRHGD